VFESVPYVHLAPPRRLVNEEVSALLVSENCQIDKRTARGLPRPNQRLLFLPVRALESFDGSYRSKMLRGEVQPPEAVYLGEHEGQKLAAKLGEVFSLPAAIFSPASVDFSSHPEADEVDPFHMTVHVRWTRLMTMEPDALTTMHRKIWLFLTGREPVDQP